MNKKIIIALAACTTLSAFAMEHAPIEQKITVKMGTSDVIVQFPIVRDTQADLQRVALTNTDTLDQYGICVSNEGDNIGGKYRLLVAIETLNPALAPDLDEASKHKLDVTIKYKTAGIEIGTHSGIDALLPPLVEYLKAQEDSKKGKRKKKKPEEEEELVHNPFFALTKTGNTCTLSFKRDQLTADTPHTTACGQLLIKLRATRDEKSASVRKVSTALEMGALYAAVYLEQALQMEG